MDALITAVCGLSDAVCLTDSFFFKIYHYKGKKLFYWQNHILEFNSWKTLHLKE